MHDFTHLNGSTLSPLSLRQWRSLMSSGVNLRTSVGVQTFMCANAFCRGLSLSCLIKVVTTWATCSLSFFDGPMTERLHHKGLMDQHELLLITVQRLSSVIVMGKIRGRTNLDHDRLNGIRHGCSLLSLEISW